MLLQKRIYEWSANLPEWQRDLLRRLASGPLDANEHRDVLKLVAGADDAPPASPLELTHLPADEEEYGPVELCGISDLSNINCLTDGQHLTFESGLNVVFGLNGAGKSGYSRLLRRICRSREAEEVLHDVFDPGAANAAQTARLVARIDGVERTLAIDLANDPDRALSAISAFDASRARLCVAGPNIIEHRPRSLRLLRDLAATQDTLVEELHGMASARREKLAALPPVAPDTAAGRALAEINATTDVAELVKEHGLDVQGEARLHELEGTAATATTAAGRDLETAAGARAASARRTVEALQGAERQLGDHALAEMNTLRQRLDDVRAGERALAGTAFSEQRFEGTGQGPWREMWFAAQRFAEAAGQPFPEDKPGAACPLCQQDLDAAALERVHAFEAFVTSDLRQQATDLGDQIQTQLRALPDATVLRTTVEAELRNLPEEFSRPAQQALETLTLRIETIRRAFTAPVPQPVGTVGDYGALIDYAEAQAVQASRLAGLRDEQAQRALLSDVAELRARAALTQAAPAIAERVKAIRAIGRIEKAAAALGTTKISHKLRELQEVVITERLRKAIEHELEELDPVAGRVEVVGKASKGETMIQLRLREPCRAKVGNVLSDGEQRALALAFFLAEVAVSDGRSAIILDDPVSSLDHERRTYLAERLAEESKRRQVIVFTHDMTFVHLLQEAAEDFGVPLHGSTLERALHRVGVVTADLPMKMLGTGRRIRALRHRLRADLGPMHRRQDPAYEREADLWLADLRKAYDQLIEDGVLNSVVRRFNAFVRVGRLRGVQCTPDVIERIEKGMRKAAPKTHHEALELQPTARTPEQLAALLDELAMLVTDLKADRDEGDAAVAASGNVTTGGSVVPLNAPRAS